MHRSNILRLLVASLGLATFQARALAQEPQQPTAASESPRFLHPFDIALNGFYRFSGEVDRGNFGFGVLAGLGGHIVPQYVLQGVAGIEIVQESTTSTLFGVGLRRDEADGASMVRVTLAAYMRHPEDDRYLPGYARRSVTFGVQGRIDALFSVGSAFVGFGYSNVIIDGDLFFSLGVLVAVE